MSKAYKSSSVKAIDQWLEEDRPTDETFEQMVGENLRFYYENEKIKSLPIAVLYRIIIAHLKSTFLTQQLVDFLFGQLELKSQDAAPLFTIIDVTPFEDEILRKICTKYEYVIPYLKSSHMLYLMNENKRLDNINQDLSLELGHMNIELSKMEQFLQKKNLK